MKKINAHIAGKRQGDKMVVLYSTPTCGICKMVKTKLQQKNISYQEINDIEALTAMNITNVPVLQIDENTTLHSPLEINKWIMNQ